VADGGGTGDVSINMGGMSAVQNGLNIISSSKTTGKTTNTSTGGSKSPAKKPFNNGGLGGLQIKPTATEGASKIML
jgi:hypothetical protein